jgi:hypothetical protein
MHFPDRYFSLDLDLPQDEEGLIRLERFYAFPPFGYVILHLFDIGNGDSAGFYWPIGREDREPLVCDSMHDGWYIEPTATNMEAFAQLRACEGWDSQEEEIAWIAQRLGFDVLPVTEDSTEAADLPVDLLEQCPARLAKVAEEALKIGNVPEAERQARQALHLLPEFTEARFLLAKCLRRDRRLEEAVPEMLETFRSPACFGNGRADCLRWLQQIADESPAAQVDDPLWRRRREITLATGVKNNADFDLYEEIIEEYLSLGQGAKAVGLRQTVGDLYARETVSFRERYGYTEDEHFRRLERELEAAGLERRAGALRRSTVNR